MGGDTVMKHIAILRQPFFDLVLSGQKTIESRFSMKKVVPLAKSKWGMNFVKANWQTCHGKGGGKRC